MESAVIRTMKFTCIGKGHGAPCTPATKEDWEALRKQPWLAQMCARIEKGEEELKHRLPVWTPHCAEFKDNHRAIADALKPLNRLMLDFDEKGHTDEILSKLKIKNEKLKMQAVHGMNVLLVEESVRKGTHVLVELPEGMEAEEAQELMKEATGFTPDKAVKDVSRCIYMVPHDHTKYVSEKMFSLTPSPSPRSLTPCPSPRGEGSSYSQKLSLQNEEQRQQDISLPSPVGEGSGVRLFKGIPYSSIIAEWFRRNGGEPEAGERNVKLHKLAVNLRAICDNKKDLLLAIMPKCGLSETELKSIIDSACKEKPKCI